MPNVRSSLIGRVGSSVSGPLPLVWMSLAGSCFSPESALRPFHHGIRGRGGAIFGSVLTADCRQIQADMRSHLIHRPARDTIPPRWSSSFLLLGLVHRVFHAAAVCLVHRNSVPSSQMRCMITASRRAKATMAFFSPRRLAICIAQALSHDHFVERTSVMWAAS